MRLKQLRRYAEADPEKDRDLADEERHMVDEQMHMKEEQARL